MLKYALPLVLASGLASADITMLIEDPTVNNVYNGVRSIRGWAVSDVPVKNVFYYFNGEIKGRMPYGGARKDVYNKFPDVQNSLNSGFSATWNYALMDEGTNSVKVVVTDENGDSAEQTTTFIVDAFEDGYMQKYDIDIGTNIRIVDDTSFIIDGALIGEEVANITLDWDVQTQSFSIININEVTKLPKNVTFTSIYKSESIVEVNKMRGTGRNCGSTWYPAVSSITWHPILAQTSLEHSIDMAANNFVSHTGSDSSSPWSRAGANGYHATAEVIAAGSDTIQGAFNQWKGSPNHCAIIMKNSRTEFGLGMAIGSDSKYGEYWTMLLN